MGGWAVFSSHAWDVRKAAICFLVLLVPVLFFVPGPVAAQESTDSTGDAQVAAVDGRRLDGESSETQVMFKAVWGDQAAVRWAEQHSAEMRHVERLDVECAFHPTDVFVGAWTRETLLRERLWCATRAAFPIQVYEKAMDTGAGPEQWFQTGEPSPTLCLYMRQDGGVGEVAKPSVPSCAEVRQGRLTIGTMQLFERGYLLYVPESGEGGLIMSNFSSQVIRP
jgi:hypothetical protein